MAAAASPTAMAVATLKEYKINVSKITSGHAKGSIPYKKAPYKNSAKFFKNFNKSSFPYAVPAALDINPKKHKTLEKYIGAITAAGFVFSVHVKSQTGEILLYDFSPEGNNAIEVIDSSLETHGRDVCPICGVSGASVDVRSHYKTHVYVKYFTSKTGHTVYGYDYGFACTASLQPALYGMSDVITLAADSVTCHACPEFAYIKSGSNRSGSKSLAAVIMQLQVADWTKPFVIPVNKSKENPLLVALEHLFTCHYQFYSCLFHNLLTQDFKPIVADPRIHDIHCFQQQLDLTWPDAKLNLSFDTLLSEYQSQLAAYCRWFLVSSIQKINGRLAQVFKPTMYLAGAEAQAGGELPPFTRAEAEQVVQQMDTGAAAAVLAQHMSDYDDAPDDDGERPGPSGEEPMTGVMPSESTASSEMSASELMPPPQEPPRRAGPPIKTTKRKDSGATKKHKDKTPRGPDGSKKTKRQKVQAEDDSDQSELSAALVGLGQPDENLPGDADGDVALDDLVTPTARARLLETEMSSAAISSFMSQYPFNSTVYDIYETWDHSMYNVDESAFRINSATVIKVAGKSTKHIVCVEARRPTLAALLSGIVGLYGYESRYAFRNPTITDKCWYPVVTSATVSAGRNPDTARLACVVEHPPGYVTITEAVATGVFQGALKKKLPYCMMQGFYQMADDGKLPIGPINSDAFLVDPNPNGSGHCVSLLPFSFTGFGLETNNLLSGRLDTFYLIAGAMMGMSANFLQTKSSFTDSDLPPDVFLKHPNLVKLKTLILSKFSKTAGENVLAMNFPSGPLPKLEHNFIAVVKNSTPWIVSAMKHSPGQPIPQKHQMWVNLVTAVLSETQDIAPQPASSAAIVFDDYSMVSNVMDMDFAVPLGDVIAPVVVATGVAPMDILQEAVHSLDLDAGFDPENVEEEEDAAMASTGSKRGRKKKRVLADEYYASAHGTKLGPGSDVKGTGKFAAAVDIIPATQTGAVSTAPIQTAAVNVLDESETRQIALQRVKITRSMTATEKRVAMAGAGMYGDYNSVPLTPRTAFQYRRVIKGPARTVYEWDYEQFKTTPDLLLSPKTPGDYQVYCMWLKNDRNGKGPHNFFSSRSAGSFTPRFGIPSLTERITLSSSSLIRTKSLWIKRFKVSNADGLLVARYTQFIKQFSELCQVAAKQTVRKHVTRHFATFFDTPLKPTSSMNAIMFVEPMGSYDMSSVSSIGTVVAGADNTAVNSHVSGIIKCVLRCVINVYKSSRYLISNVTPGYIWFNSKRRCYVMDVLQALYDSVFFSSSLLLAMSSMTGLCTSLAETFFRIGLADALDPELKAHVEQMRDTGSPFGGWPPECKTITNKLYHLCVLFGLVDGSSVPMWTTIQTVSLDMGPVFTPPAIVVPNTLGTNTLAFVSPAFIYTSKMRFAWETSVVTVPILEKAVFYGKNREEALKMTRYHMIRMYEDEGPNGKETDSETAESNSVVKNREQWMINPEIPPENITVQKRKKPDDEEEEQPTASVLMPPPPPQQQLMMPPPPPPPPRQ